jgi:riboflavin kinase/FMN adenylyltransferase
MLEIVTGIEEVKADRPTALAVGVFDGVHRGHEALLAAVVASAEKQNARPAALTFYPNPREVITGKIGRYYLTPLEERLQRIAAQGIDLIIAHPFNDAVRYMRATEFVRQMVSHLRLCELWGGNFSLGYQREGNFDFLNAHGRQNGFSVNLFAPFMAGDERISSSRIRRSLEAGDVADAACCLGRPYAIGGEVVLGRQLGRTIGVPTANVAVWEKQVLPKNGVYATRVQLGDASFLAATNVGVRPTVEGTSHISVEPHILDFDRDIYGETLRVEFVARVRDEQKFASLDTLKGQISADIAKVRALLQ